MLRLLLLLLCVGAILMGLLQLRQQQQALRAHNLKLHRQIRHLEQTLWRQQVLVGAEVAPGNLRHHPDPEAAERPAVVLPEVGTADWDRLFPGSGG